MKKTKICGYAGLTRLFLFHNPMKFLACGTSATAVIITMLGAGLLYSIWGHSVVPLSLTPLTISLFIGVFLVVAAGTAAGLIIDNGKKHNESLRHSPAAICGWSGFIGLVVSLLTNLALHAMVMLRSTLRPIYAILLTCAGAILVTNALVTVLFCAARAWGCNAQSNDAVKK